jgi:GDP-L-fucose synthase
MPTNLYGPSDNYDLNNSHVLPALIRKFHTAKVEKTPSVEIWGSGKPEREFLHVDDLAEACYYLMMHYNEAGFVNVGFGDDISIKNLALLVKKTVGYEGDIHFNSEKPDGTPKKLMNSSKINAMGWKAQIPLDAGVASVYAEVEKSNW